MTAVRLALLVLLLCLSHPQPGKCGVAHIVYSKERDDVKIPCKNVVNKDCSTTTWISSIPGTETVELVGLGKIKSDRITLDPNCSLEIINVTSQDVGKYICQQYLNEDGPRHGEETCVYLSILTVSSSIPASQMKADTNVIFYCHLAIHDSSRNDMVGTKLAFGFDQHQVKDVYPYNISFTRTLTKEDNNRKLQCEVKWNGEHKATVDYIINLQGQDGSHPVGLIGAVVGTVAVALCAFLVFLWRRKAKRQMANVRFENVSTKATKEKTEGKGKTSGQSKQAPEDQGITYAEITIKADTRKHSDKLTFQHETEYSTIKTI